MRVVLMSLFVLALAYFYADRQLFFYGKSDFEIYHPLPLNVKPDYWGYDQGNLGFIIEDQYDFTIVTKGKNRYRSSEVFVKEILKYGFDKKQVVVAVVDSLGHEHSIVLQTGDKPEIDALVDAQVDFNDATWIEVKGKESYVKSLVWVRSIVRIGLFIVIVIIGFRSVRGLIRKMTEP